MWQQLIAGSFDRFAGNCSFLRALYFFDQLIYSFYSGFPLAQTWVSRIFLFEFTNLGNQEFPVGQERLLALRGVESVITPISLGANPAGVPADAPSVYVSQNSRAVKQWMQ